MDTFGQYFKVTIFGESHGPAIGVYEGFTTGSPLTIVFWNSNVQSQDYLQFDDVPRPGHADFVANIKYNFANDPRGGGHFSGRLTLPIVAAGVVAH